MQPLTLAVRVGLKKVKKMIKKGKKNKPTPFGIGLKDEFSVNISGETRFFRRNDKNNVPYYLKAEIAPHVSSTLLIQRELHH